MSEAVPQEGKEDEDSILPSFGEVIPDLLVALPPDDQSLPDHLSFSGPLDHFDRPEPYLEALRKLHPIVERVDMHKVFVDGDDVCVVYDLVTKTPAGTALVAEWHHVRGEKIDSVRVIFDARPFAAMFQRRPTPPARTLPACEAGPQANVFRAERFTRPYPEGVW